MEFLRKIWEKIKAFFCNKAEVVDQATIDAERAQRLRDLNDPEDDFENDVAYNEDELLKLSRKSANRRNMRTGYYIFGTMMAIALILWGVIGLLVTPKPDISIMIQADGLVENADIESVRALVADAVGDRNGDGQVVVEVTEISMPAEHTEENQSAFDVAHEDINAALVPPNIGMIIGREDFLAEADDATGLQEQRLSLAQVVPELHENNPLREYLVAARAGESDQAVLAAEVLAEMAK